MATVVDDELDQTTDSAVNDPAAARGARTNEPVTAPSDEPNPAIGETDIGVVVTPGRGDEPDIVSGYFVTQGDDGRIVNDTGIATARLLAAARSSGRPIYVKRNGRVYRGRLEPSGQSVVALDPIVPSNDLVRSMYLPANEQHRLMDRHLEAVEAVEHLVAPPMTDTAPPAARASASPIPPQVSIPPIGRPAASPLASSAERVPALPGTAPVTPPPSVQPSIDIPQTSSAPPLSSRTMTVSGAGETPPGINESTIAVQMPNVVADEAGATASPEFTPAQVPVTPSPAITPPLSPPSTFARASADKLAGPRRGRWPEGGRGEEGGPTAPTAPVLPLEEAQLATTQPQPNIPSPTGTAPTKASKSTPATGHPAGPQPAPPTPRYGRRPRRAAPRSSVPAPTTTPTDQAPSPAFAQTGVHPAILPGHVEPAAGRTEARPFLPPVNQSGGQAVAPAPSPPPTGRTVPRRQPAGAPPPSHPDHQAYRPSVPVAPPEAEAAVEGAPVSSTLPAQTPSPEAPAAEAKVPAPIAPQSASADQPRPPEIVGGGQLEGVDEEYRPFTAPAPTPAATPTERTASSAEESPEFQDAAARETAGGAEGQTPEMMAQELRSQKLAAQRRAQFEAADRARQRQAIQAGQKAKDIPVQYESEKERAEKTYKRGWQIAQEVAEDQALSMTDLFLFSGPAVVGLYLLRWMGGNMMGNMFTKEITARPSFGSADGSDTKISVQLIPGYSISDPIDYVRHMKFLIVAAWTGVIYGFIFVFLWLITNLGEAAKLGLKTIGAIVNFFSGQ